MRRGPIVGESSPQCVGRAPGGGAESGGRSPPGSRPRTTTDAVGRSSRRPASVVVRNPSAAVPRRVGPGLPATVGSDAACRARRSRLQPPRSSHDRSFPHRRRPRARATVTRARVRGARRRLLLRRQAEPERRLRRARPRRGRRRRRPRVGGRRPVGRARLGERAALRAVRPHRQRPPRPPPRGAPAPRRPPREGRTGARRRAPRALGAPQHVRRAPLRARGAHRDRGDAALPARPQRGPVRRGAGRRARARPRLGRLGAREAARSLGRLRPRPRALQHAPCDARRPPRARARPAPAHPRGEQRAVPPGARHGMTGGVRVGRPAPAALVASYFLTALLAWLAATIALVAAAPQLADAGVASPEVLLAVHLVGLGFLPLAVTGAVLHVLPTLLRNDACPARGWAALPLLCGGPVLAFAIAHDHDRLTWIAAAAETAGFVVVAWEIVTLVVQAPHDRMLLASRFGILLSTFNAAAALAVGAGLADRGFRPLLGIPHDRAIGIHLNLAVLGWLTLLIVTVGRTLTPMLSLAPATPRRRLPLEELVLTGGLWILVAGLALGARPLMIVGALLAL